MAPRSLDEITGIGKTITVRDKRTGMPYRAGRIIDEASVLLDGEQKYVAQHVLLEEGVCSEGDPTRYVIRVGYYTQRTDGCFCFGSQHAPIMTPQELRTLIQRTIEKGWLRDPVI